MYLVQDILQQLFYFIPDYVTITRYKRTCKRLRTFYNKNKESIIPHIQNGYPPVHWDGAHTKLDDNRWIFIGCGPFERVAARSSRVYDQSHTGAIFSSFPLDVHKRYEITDGLNILYFNDPLRTVKEYRWKKDGKMHGPQLIYMIVHRNDHNIKVTLREYQEWETGKRQGLQQTYHRNGRISMRRLWNKNYIVATDYYYRRYKNGGFDERNSKLPLINSTVVPQLDSYDMVPKYPLL